MEKTLIRPELTFKMYELISGYWIACAIHTIAELRLADLLLQCPMSVKELATASDAHPGSLYRLLRAAASVGIFEESTDGMFSLNALGETLLSKVKGSVRPWALANLGEHYPAFGNLTYGVKTGKIPFDEVHGVSLWDYYKAHPKAGENLVEAMAGMSGAVIEGITAAYDFSSFETIVDIGGGNGALLFSVLDTAVKSKGIVFDEPYVIQQTENHIPVTLKARCKVIGGSFFEVIPAGADLYLTKWVLHDWNDDEVLLILKTCFKAMKVGSKLLIIEAVIADDKLNTPHAAKLLDLNVMAMSPGKERSVKEFKALIETAGLTFNRLIFTNTELSSMIECEKY